MFQGDQKNLILAVGISIFIIAMFQLFFPTSKKQGPDTATVSEKILPQTESAVPSAVVASRDDAQKRQGLSFRTDVLQGSLNLVGGKVDDVQLIKYREEVDPQSSPVALLSGGSYIQTGWLGETGTVPTEATKWAASGTLGNGKPLVLSWRNGKGQVFEQVYQLDDKYLLTITQRVRHEGGASVKVVPYGKLVEVSSEERIKYFAVHEGALGIINHELEEIKYDDLEDEAFEAPTTGGWFGFTSQYWLKAFLPDGGQAKTMVRFNHVEKEGRSFYQNDYVYPEFTLARGETKETTHRVYLGAKEVDTLQSYQDKLGIDRLELAIDYGWYYFLTKPFEKVLLWLFHWVGNFGVAILLFTIGLRILLYPLANKSFSSMTAMKKLHPEVKRLQELYKSDAIRLNQEVAGLYRKHNVNPVSGCLPILVQIPIFFSLYKVLLISIEMRHAPFFGWLKDLSDIDPTTMFNLFGLLPWEPWAWLPHLGVLPLLMGLSMYIQQKLNPQPTDPLQARIMSFLPIIFTFLLAGFPAGLVLYWTWNNILSMIQQKFIMFRSGVK